MKLQLKDTIQVSTNQGVCEIHLCFGDIATLSMENKVDIIMISAFPGDYAPISGTLIGSLLRNFKINVRNLAADKEEDLRQHFHCWLSKPLPNDVPYKRLLCFEQSRRAMESLQDSKATLVAHIFRALFTYMSHSEEFSVITPLLGTGNQRQDKSVVMKTMLNSCIAWMRAGMPLKRLLLVIYKVDEKSSLAMEDAQAVKEFQRIKEATEKANTLRSLPTIELDSYVVYTEQDRDVMQKFLEYVRTNGKLATNHDIRIVCNLITKDDSATTTQQAPKSADKTKPAIPSPPPLPGTTTGCTTKSTPPSSASKSLMKKPATWFKSTSAVLLGTKTKLEEENVETIMLKSKHVFVALSSHLLESSRGPEYYNLALCLSRLAKRQLLIPLYVHTIPNLPTYMALIQWVDLRLKERDKPGTDKVKEGADNVLALLQKAEEPAPKMTDKNKTQKSTTPQSEPGYDLFISYCHRDSAVALELLQAVQAAHPQLQIFFDKNEIKTGFSWQVTVYEALCHSKVVVALLSSAYFQSSVCSEELALALSRQRCNAGSTYLIPVAVQEAPLVEVATSLLTSEVPILVAPDGMDKKLFVKKLADSLTSFKHEDLKSNLIFGPAAGKGDLKHQSLQQALTECREKFYKSLWRVNADGQLQWQQQQTSPEMVAGPHEVLILHHDDEANAAKLLKVELEERWDGNAVRVECLSCSTGPQSTQASARLDSVHCAVLFLSPLFVTTSLCLDVLQVALCLHRSKGSSGQFHLCSVLLSSPLPEEPFYLHLLPCRFAAFDPFMVRMAETWVSSDTVRRLKNNKLGASGLPATTLAVLHCVAEWLGTCTAFGRLPKDQSKGLPVLLSVMDLQGSGFVAPKLTGTWTPELFREVNFEEASLARLTIM